MSEAIEKLKEVTLEEWNSVHELNREILEEFLQQQHLSPQTLRQYESCLKIFFRFIMEKCKNLPIYELKPKHALQYQNFLMARGMSSSAVKIKRSAVSSLCGYIEVYYADEYPLFRNIYNKKIPNPPKTARHEKKPLTPDEITKLVEELKNRKEYQMIAYLLFSYDSGCRRAETNQILKEITTYPYLKDPKTGEDKNYYQSHPIRTKGKGKEGLVRKLTFTDLGKDAAIKWLEIRGEDDCPFLFVQKTKAGKTTHLNAGTFNSWCREVFGEIIGRRVHPHQLRASRATNLSLYEDKNIEKIKGLLGHKSSETTKIYIVNEDENDIGDLFD